MGARVCRPGFLRQLSVPAAVMVALLGWQSTVFVSELRAQGPNNQQKVDDLIRSARQAETLGYVLGVAGILIIAAAIPVGIYMDRKKARKRVARQEVQGLGACKEQHDS